MFPLFHAVDHRIDLSPLPLEERRVLRRSAPERLRFDLPSAGVPVVRPVPAPAPEPVREGSGGRLSRLASLVRLWSPA